MPCSQPDKSLKIISDLAYFADLGLKLDACAKCGKREDLKNCAACRSVSIVNVKE